MAVTLGAATIKAQQALSEKFGIPTFNLTGGISTVPTTGKISNINVGTGMFTGDTQKTFSSSLNQLISSAKETGGTIGNTVFKSPTPNPNTTNDDDAGKQGTGGTFGQSLNEGFSQAGDFLKSNPLLLVGMFALIGLMVIKK